jgi:hypothetical protein
LAAVTQRREAQACSLLHLDLRPVNLAVHEGRIISVFDLSNACIGDPWLELARVRGCGLLSSAFLEGYRTDMIGGAEFETALDCYELDLAALLVVVSREEFDDLPLHATMSERTMNLIERIIAGTGS